MNISFGQQSEVSRQGGKYVLHKRYNTLDGQPVQGITITPVANKKEIPGRIQFVEVENGGSKPLPGLVYTSPGGQRLNLLTGPEYHAALAEHPSGIFTAQA